MRCLPALLCALLAGGGALAQETPARQAAPEPPSPPESPTAPPEPAAPEAPAPMPEQAAPAPPPSKTTPPATAAPTPVETTPLAAPPTTDSLSLDFNLLPETTVVPLDPELESQIHKRRAMLEIHQALGIATVALLATSVVFGQLNYTDRFGGGPNLGTYSLWHSGFAVGATLTFAASGIIALAAPVPLEKESRVDTITVHKWSMLVAALGFATEIVLGIVTASREGYVDQASLAEAHLVIGYVTLGAVGVGTAALFF